VHFVNGLLNWKQGMVDAAIHRSSTVLLVNDGMELTACFAPASGSRSGVAFRAQLNQSQQSP
jgi:hypothetical protein